MKKLLLIFLSLITLFSFKDDGYFKNPFPKKIIFQGNSLFDTGINHVTNNLKYVTLGIYDSLRESYPGLVLVDYSISGQNQVQINSKMYSQYNSNLVDSQSVCVIWEGTNDLAHYPSKTGTQAFAGLKSFTNHLDSLGIKLVVCTVIARDLASDPGNLMTRIAVYNDSIRANFSGNRLCDLGSLSMFNDRADASNTTYYQDKLHLYQAGQDIVLYQVKNKIQEYFEN